MNLAHYEIRNIQAFAAKVTPIYRLLGRRWYGGRTPSVSDIEETLLELADHVKSSNGVTKSGTGGLYVMKDDYYLYVGLDINSIIDEEKYEDLSP